MNVGYLSRSSLVMKFFSRIFLIVLALTPLYFEVVRNVVLQIAYPLMWLLAIMYSFWWVFIAFKRPTRFEWALICINLDKATAMVCCPSDFRGTLYKTEFRSYKINGTTICDFNSDCGISYYEMIISFLPYVPIVVLLSAIVYIFLRGALMNINSYFSAEKEETNVVVDENTSTTVKVRSTPTTNTFICFLVLLCFASVVPIIAADDRCHGLQAAKSRKRGIEPCRVESGVEYFDPHFVQQNVEFVKTAADSGAVGVITGCTRYITDFNYEKPPVGQCFTDDGLKELPYNTGKPLTRNGTDLLSGDYTVNKPVTFSYGDNEYKGRVLSVSTFFDTFQPAGHDAIHLVDVVIKLSVKSDIFQLPETLVQQAHQGGYECQRMSYAVSNDSVYAATYSCFHYIGVNMPFILHGVRLLDFGFNSKICTHSEGFEINRMCYESSDQNTTFYTFCDVTGLKAWPHSFDFAGNLQRNLSACSVPLSPILSVNVCDGVECVQQFGECENCNMPLSIYESHGQLVGYHQTMFSVKPCFTPWCYLMKNFKFTTILLIIAPLLMIILPSLLRWLILSTVIIFPSYWRFKSKCHGRKSEVHQRLCLKSTCPDCKTSFASPGRFRTHRSAHRLYAVSSFYAWLLLLTASPVYGARVIELSDMNCNSINECTLGKTTSINVELTDSSFVLRHGDAAINMDIRINSTSFSCEYEYSAYPFYSKDCVDVKLSDSDVNVPQVKSTWKTPERDQKACDMVNASGPWGCCDLRIGASADATDWYLVHTYTKPIALTPLTVFTCKLSHMKYEICLNDDCHLHDIDVGSVDTGSVMLRVPDALKQGVRVGSKQLYGTTMTGLSSVGLLIADVPHYIDTEAEGSVLHYTSKEELANSSNIRASKVVQFTPTCTLKNCHWPYFSQEYLANNFRGIMDVWNCDFGTSAIDRTTSRPSLLLNGKKCNLGSATLDLYDVEGLKLAPRLTKPNSVYLNAFGFLGISQGIQVSIRSDTEPPYLVDCGGATSTCYTNEHDCNITFGGPSVYHCNVNTFPVDLDLTTFKYQDEHWEHAGHDRVEDYQYDTSDAGREKPRNDENDFFGTIKGWFSSFGSAIADFFSSLFGTFSGIPGLIFKLLVIGVVILIVITVITALIRRLIAGGNAPSAK